MVDIDDKKGSTITKPPTPTLHSLDDLQIHLSPDIRQHLADQYKDDHHYMERLLNAMKRPTATTICRVNLIQATRAQVVQELKRILSSHHHHVVQESPIFSDVVTIVTQDTASSSSLSSHAIPQTSPNTPSLFPNWPKRKDKGWPMTHKVILVDRFCGEAVLRGSDIFVKGVMAADYGIKPGEIVAVYADIPTTKTKTDLNGKARTVPHKVARGLLLEHYSGTCVFLGLGTTACARGEMFNQDRGVAVTMSMEPHERVGPLLPPLYGVLDDKMMLQNLPSILVAHALNPQPHDTVLDMCMAPGGKTAHLASLVNNQAVIVACDKSRKKVVSAKSLFARLGASCVTPLALDATKCVSDDSQEPTSIRKIIDEAKLDPIDGLKNINQFPSKSFDRILLDPPCSALGLRPKLYVAQQTLRELEKHSEYQRKFVDQAVQLLKPGGLLTYSTCTMNALENEHVVKYVLDTHPAMELVPIKVTDGAESRLGRPGLEGFGLNDQQRMMVRRFDPGDPGQDTMGFFVALFRKRGYGH